RLRALLDDAAAGALGSRGRVAGGAVRHAVSGVIPSGPVEWLNYHHLLYFWAVARYGTVARASAELRLSQPTISGQVKRVEDFLGQLVGQELDLVFADRPVGPGIRAHAFNHLLGESGTSFFASEKLAKRLTRGFPQSLDGAPCLLPSDHATVRRRVDQWFD